MRPLFVIMRALLTFSATEWANGVRPSSNSAVMQSEDEFEEGSAAFNSTGTQSQDAQSSYCCCAGPPFSDPSENGIKMCEALHDEWFEKDHYYYNLPVNTAGQTHQKGDCCWHPHKGKCNGWKWISHNLHQYDSSRSHSGACPAAAGRVDVGYASMKGVAMQVTLNKQMADAIRTRLAGAAAGATIAGAFNGANPIAGVEIGKEGYNTVHLSKVLAFVQGTGQKLYACSVQGSENDEGGAQTCLDFNAVLQRVANGETIGNNKFVIPAPAVQ